MKKGKRVLIGCICFIIFSFVYFPANSQTFVHPGILNNQCELSFIKAKIDNAQQPWKNAYDKLKASPSASLTYKARPKATTDCGSYNKDVNGNTVPECATFVEDAMAAYSHALMWYFSGNMAHANKSIEILNAWSNVYVSNAGSNARLNVSWAAPWYVNAAEILRHANVPVKPNWAAADLAKFNVMVNKFLPYVKDETMPGNNWIQSAIEAHFSIAVYTDNRTEFNNAIGRWKIRVKTYIYQTTDGLTPKDYPTGNVVLKPSTWSGAKTFINGLGMETYRDLGHLMLGFNSMMYAAQIAWEQNEDLFLGEQKRLTDFMELHGGWMIGDVAVPKTVNGGNINCSGQASAGYLPCGQTAWEIAFNHLQTRLGRVLPYTLKMINGNRPKNAGGWVTKWETLTHGNLPFNLGTLPTVSVTSPQTVTSNVTPTNIILNAFASDVTGITKVEFYLGAVLLNTSYAPPYTYTYAGAASNTYSFSAKAYNNCNLSTTAKVATIIVSPVGLPVSLLNFSAKKGAMEQVEIEWFTAIEINNDKFILERSTNGIDFYKIAEVKGRNSVVQEEYNYTDILPHKGLNYYRLSQLDFDGKIELLGIRKVLLDPLVDISISISPNPTNGDFLLQLDNCINQHLYVQINDMFGKSIFESNYITTAPTVEIPLQLTSTLSSGHYVVHVSGVDWKVQSKLVVH